MFLVVDLLEQHVDQKAVVSCFDIAMRCSGFQKKRKNQEEA